MTRESEIQHDVHERLGRRSDLRIWRQNVGAGVPMSAASMLVRVAELVRAGNYGSARALAGPALSAAQRVVRYGVEGGGDLSGILADGRRLEIEVKSAKGEQSEQQERFGEMIGRFHGVYLVVRDADEAEYAVVEAIRNPAGSHRPAGGSGA